MLQYRKPKIEKYGEAKPNKGLTVIKLTEEKKEDEEESFKRVK